MCGKRRADLVAAVAFLLISTVQAQEKQPAGSTSMPIKVGNPQMCADLLHTELVRRQIGFSAAQQKQLEPFEEAVYKTNSPSTTLAACARLEEAIRRILLPVQSARLDEIFLQGLGPSLFESPDVTEAIGISREQNEKIRGILEAGTRAEHEIILAAGLDVPLPVSEVLRTRNREAAKKMQVVKKASFGKIIDMLTPEQRGRLAAITGEKVDVDELSDQVWAVQWITLTGR